jgi:hypothetical protein
MRLARARMRACTKLCFYLVHSLVLVHIREGKSTHSTQTKLVSQGQAMSWMLRRGLGPMAIVI